MTNKTLKEMFDFVLNKTLVIIDILLSDLSGIIILCAC